MVRKAKVAFLVLAVAALGAALAAKLYGTYVEEPALAEQAFDITRPSTPPPAPELLVETPDGRPLVSADLKGQVVFVNFWATWCPPCRDEMPSMLDLGRELARKYPGKFRMVAVSVDDGWDPIRQFFAGRVPSDVVVTLDRSQETMRSYYCDARGGCPPQFQFPESYIVDRSGRLVAYVIGPRDWSEPAARRFLERLIRS